MSTELDRLTAMTSCEAGWQDISTAPKDGRDLFLLGRFRDTETDQPVVGRWFQAGKAEQDGWWSAYALQLTPCGWMPIPPAVSTAA